MFWRGKIRAYVADIMNNIAVCPELPMEGQKTSQQFCQSWDQFGKTLSALSVSLMALIRQRYWKTDQTLLY